MKFKEAFEEMKSGIPVKLPSWAGYWWWDEESQTILMYTKDGDCLDIRETQNVEYTLQNIFSDEWVYADSRNCPILGGEATFSFGEAIKYLKRGMKGWKMDKRFREEGRIVRFAIEFRVCKSKKCLSTWLRYNSYCLLELAPISSSAICFH